MGQGRGKAGQAIADDAKAVADPDAFSVVLEKISGSLADRITAEIDIPTIGIGASQECDGQILVIDDMLGLFTDFRPKFVKRYAELATASEGAIHLYAEDVRTPISHSRTCLC